MEEGIGTAVFYPWDKWHGFASCLPAQREEIVGFVDNDPQDITWSCLVVDPAPRIGDPVSGLVQPLAQLTGGTCSKPLILGGGGVFLQEKVSFQPK